MRRLFLTLVLSAACVLCHAQVDSTALARMDAMLEQYVAALEHESEETKFAECDFLISSCTDSALRQSVALRLFDHYQDSRLMGEEAVAIHIFDRWFADGQVRMRSEMDLMQARLFAEYNRQSLLGLEAPVLQMYDMHMEPVLVPGHGKCQSVLYFYDTSCSKCMLESVLLKYCLDEVKMPLDFYAVYVGSDLEAWKGYVAEHFDISSTDVRIHHVWDPDVESAFHEKYAVLQTPRMYLVGESGRILGRRLTVDALAQMLSTSQIEYELVSRNPVGTSLPDLTVPATVVKGRRERVRSVNLSSLRKTSFVFFMSEGCSNCKAERAAMLQALGRKEAVVMVDVDRILAEDAELAKQLFAAFDLTVLPHIIALDRKGIVTDRYVSFVK